MSQIDKFFNVLELFFQHPKGLQLSEVSDKLGIPLATAHRMLGVFKDRGYLTQDMREEYHLSLLLPSMGKNFIASTGFSELLQPHLNRLALETGEHIRLAAVVEGQLIWVLRAVESGHGLQYRGAPETKIIPHITASGKLWLSTLKEEEAVRIMSNWNIAESKTYGGSRAKATIKELLDDLEKIRKDRFSIIIEEAEVGVAAAAIGVYEAGDTGILAGTLSLAGPTARLDRKKLIVYKTEMQKTAHDMQEAWNLWAAVNTSRIETR